MTNHAQPQHAETVLGGRYRLGRLLGQGGMGSVYEADVIDGPRRRVAVKLLHASLSAPEDSARFAREARICASLSSPNIARVVDAGVDPALHAPYIVMELLSGRDLDSVLQRCGALDPGVAALIVYRACLGVEAAHAAGVVHRDLKPANLFLDAPPGEPIEVKVCDFGLAKPLLANDAMTRTEEVFGSPQYMSPEQARSTKHVDARADVWSLGATLYELLTGTTPFSHAKDVSDLLVMLASQEAPHLQDRAPWVPEALAIVTHGALLRDPDARCPNVGALLDALRPFIDESRPIGRDILAPPAPSVQRERAPRATLPRSWADVEALPQVAARRDEVDKTSTVRLLGHKVGGGYPLLRVLGQGGMGAVYETRGPRGERLAIKMIQADLRRSPSALGRFVSEARASMAITSEHVVKVFGADTDPSRGVPYIVMELLEGRDLAELIRSSGPLEVGAAARVFVEATMGLAAAHRLGIVHRDIKPANLFLQETPSGRVVTKICDFGVAKRVFADDVDDTAVDLTRTGGLVGSPMYFSPEQSRNAKNVDHRSDVFSLAASLYEALSGRRVWEQCDGVGEIIIALATRDAPPLGAVAPWVPPELAAIVHKGLQRDPAERFASVEEMGRALERFATRGPLDRSALKAAPQERRAAGAHGATGYASTLDAAPSRRSRGPLLAVLGISGVIVGVSAFGLARGGWSPSRASAVPSAPASASIATAPIETARVVASAPAPPPDRGASAPDSGVEVTALPDAPSATKPQVRRPAPATSKAKSKARANTTVKSKARPPQPPSSGDPEATSAAAGFSDNRKE